MAEERLQKFLSSAGIASRRKAETMIAEGRVKVNGEIVTEQGTRVRPGVDHVQVDGMAVAYDPRHVYLLLYKPTRVISSVSDPEGREVVTDLVPPSFGRVYPVGRLDWDSEGAILMTNDGRLTELLTHPRYEVTKVYMVKVDGIVAGDDRRIELLRHGVRLDDGYVTQPAEVSRDADTGRHTWFVVGIKEGRNRQVRRMFEAIGLDVRKLKRIAYGPVPLGDMLPGDYRRLNEDEIDDLYEAAGEERDILGTSRGRLHVSRRARAQRDQNSQQPRKLPVAPEALGMDGVFSKSERNLLQRQARDVYAGPESADGQRLDAQDVDAPRKRRPGDFRLKEKRAKPAPAPTGDSIPMPSKPKRRPTGGRPLRSSSAGGASHGAGGGTSTGGGSSTGGASKGGGYRGGPKRGKDGAASGGTQGRGQNRGPNSGGGRRGGPKGGGSGYGGR